MFEELAASVATRNSSVLSSSPCIGVGLGSFYGRVIRSERCLARRYMPIATSDQESKCEATNLYQKCHATTR